ncbi:MAG: ROK family transcriptional regulator [Thiolinea sp.]
MAHRPTGGSNLTGIAQYNERLILQLIRRSGSLPKAEIARMTNLSAQTASVIINRLIQQKLLCKHERRISTGKVGQPAIPIALNPNGAFSLGVKLGRRSLDLILINFVGDILQQITHTYDYPDPSFIFPAIDQGLEQLRQQLRKHERERLLGVGIAAPYGIGGWQQEVDIPDTITEQWNTIDIKQRVQKNQPETAWLVNDATAACIASLEFDNPEKFNHYLYIFVGTFIGGGIIMNHTLYNGISNNAGAIGSMPLPSHYADAQQTDNPTSGKTPVQLINCASRYLLNRRFEAIGLEPDQALEAFASQPEEHIPDTHVRIVHDWLEQTAPAIAYAITAAVSIIDFEGVIIDGLLPAPLTHDLTRRVDAEMQRLDLEGLSIPRLHAGSIGNKARALGGAFLPFTPTLLRTAVS